jgi:site-specific recombinase XerD
MRTLPDVSLPGDAADAEVRVAVTQALRRYVQASKAPNTVRAYDSDLRHFQSWCRSRHALWLPATAETVALYIASLARSRHQALDPTAATLRDRRGAPPREVVLPHR